MNYVIAYWLAPEASEQRKQALKRYFDLQRHTKERFGAKQIIVTNLDYEGAIKFIEPAGFTWEYGMFAPYFALGQLLRNGLEYPITLHDHDMFIREPLTADPKSILCCSKGGHCFSDQLVVFPEISDKALRSYIKKLETLDFYVGYHQGYGSEVRHERMYSSEVTLANMDPNPFTEVPIEIGVSYRDLVSFDILAHHSLDDAICDSGPIPIEVQAVHGHLNKGPATEALINWLAQCEN